MELMIGMTIFAVMSVAIMSIYIQTTNLGQKMRAMRHLSETAREITERIGEDVREYGISLSGSFDPSWNYIPWDEYSSSLGSEFLSIDERGSYVYGQKTTTGMNPCIDSTSELRKTDPKIHCGLYKVWRDDNGTSGWNLVDSFVPEEEKKRVKIEDLKFYVSGDGISSEKKVTLVFTVALMPRIWVPPALISDTRMHIQTTFWERFYKTAP